MNNFKIKDWVCVSRLPSFNVFQNQLTAELTEEYVLEVHSEEVLETFLTLASSQFPQITKLLHFQKFTKYDPICYSFNSFTIRLYSEFIESRLKEIGTIPDVYLFQIIYETLIGFETVYRNLRPLKATYNNIGFNKKNELRIVLYEDLINQPFEQLSQQSIVVSVLDVYRPFLPYNITIPTKMNFTQAIYFIGYRASNSTSIISAHKLTRKQPRFSVVQPKTRLPGQSAQSSYKQPQLEFHQDFGSFQSNFSKFSSSIFSNTSTQKQCSNIIFNVRPTFHMNIEQARTTQNNLSVINDLIELDSSHLPLELLDDKKPQYLKLSIIDKILENVNSDEDLKKMCSVYKHAILYDPVLYQELKKVKGRTQQIQNSLIRKKIQQIIESKNKFEGLTTRIPNLVFSSNQSIQQAKTQRNQRIKRIIQNEKRKIQQQQTIKPGFKTAFNSSRNSPSKSPTKHGQKIRKLNQFKEEAQKILFDF